MIGVFLFFGLVIFGGAALNAIQRHDAIPILTIGTEPPPSPALPVTMSRLRQYDANFSEIVFADFCYSLYARLHEARGRGRLDDYAPYVSAGVREGMKRHARAGLTSVDAIVIGSFAVAEVRGIDRPQVEVDIEFEANYTETAADGTRRWYVRERWTLARARDLLSPTPLTAKAEHCPKCGAALETRTDGACLHCATVVADGTFHWFVRAVAVLEKDERPPQLGGGSGPDPGLYLPTVRAAWIERNMTDFAQQHPGFTWEAFEGRVRQVANELQAAWTARDWQRARAYETDALFQMHRYWIDEYLRQGLRNIVDGYAVEKLEVAKVTTDAFYDAITVRLHAAGADYTVNEAGELVGGSNYAHSWSEYWTFIRGRAGAPRDAPVCPNCGGPRAAGQTVVCAYCGGKITTGDFPWILSRIEQDEAYRG